MERFEILFHLSLCIQIYFKNSSFSKFSRIFFKPCLIDLKIILILIVFPVQNYKASREKGKILNFNVYHLLKENEDNKKYMLLYKMNSTERKHSNYFQKNVSLLRPFNYKITRKFSYSFKNAKNAKKNI